MHAAIWHHLLRAGELLTLDATQKSRKGARSRGSFGFSLRLQLVDSRRFDAFVAYPHFSRVHGGASPIVAYVSALLVRVRVCDCGCVLRCQLLAWVCLWGVPVCVRVRACVLASKVKEGEEVGHHDLAIALRLGFLVGLQPMFLLERDLYFYLFVIIAMHAAVLHHLLRAGELLLLMPLERVARRLDQGELRFCLCFWFAFTAGRWPSLGCFRR